MTSINMASILAKAKGYTNSKEGKIRMNDMAQKVLLGQISLQSGEKTHTPEEAAAKFIEVLKSSISSSGISADAASAISELGSSSPRHIKDNVYEIDIYFEGNLSRPSLQEGIYGGIDNLAALLNNGVDHTMKQVIGEWHGQKIRSRTVIPGAHFVQNAVSDFIGNYGQDYNVIDIQIDGKFS